MKERHILDDVRRGRISATDLDENGKFKRPPRQFPNMFRGEEYPTDFETFAWAEHMEELEEGTVVGRTNGQFPQVLIWSQGGVIGISPERYQSGWEKTQDPEAKGE